MTFFTVLFFFAQTIYLIICHVVPSIEAFLIQQPGSFSFGYNQNFGIGSNVAHNTIIPITQCRSSTQSQQIRTFLGTSSRSSNLVGSHRNKIQMNLNQDKTKESKDSIADLTQETDGVNREDDTQPPSQINTKSSMLSEKIIQAAADLTTSTSKLLGVKSIGVDYGLVRTGIAVSNGYNPQPLSIVSKLNNTQLSTHIIKLVESENAHQVVMGLPFHKNGTEAEQTIITRNYASQLNCALCAHFGMSQIPIYLWDERYTSKEAESRIRAENPRAGNLSRELDADAASIILEYYYGDNGLGAEKVELPENEEVRDAIEKAWLIRKEEKLKALEALREQRMNAGNVKQRLMEKARLLDEKLAKERNENDGMNKNKKSKKKKKKKKKWINLSPNMENLQDD